MPEVSEAFVEQAVDLHEAEQPHHDSAECDAHIAMLEARIAVLEAEAHRHEEYTEDEGIEVEEV